MHSFRTTTLLLALVAVASSLSATTANASLDEVMAIRGHQNMRARRNTVNSIVSNHGSALRRKRLTQVAQELAARQADDTSSSSTSASETASGTSVDATATSTGATSSGTTSTATGTGFSTATTGTSTGTGTATSTSVVATTTATFDTVGEDTDDYVDEDDEDDDSTTTTSSATSTSTSSSSTVTSTKKHHHHHHHHSSSSSAATTTATTSTKKKSSKKNKSCKTKSTNSNLVATDDTDSTDDSSSSASGSSSTKTSATATSTKASSSGSSGTSSAATATGTGLLSGASDITENGEITYFAVGLGACGYTDTDSDYIAALPVGLWNSIGGADVWEGNIVCNKKIMISKGDTVITVTVRDQCPTCANNHLDLSPSAFKALAPLVEGEVSVSWGWIGGVPT